MTYASTSPSRAFSSDSFPALCRARAAGLALFAALVTGCGGDSTDTGNPPVLVGQKLRLTASAGGVTVSGESGAVPGGARVEVVNTRTGATVSTEAAPDGSFSIDVDGSVTDEYRVYATLEGENWRTSLTSSGASEPEIGLEGLESLLSSAQGFTPAPGTTVRLSFREGQIGFSAGCNSHGGPYSLCDGKLCVSELASTAIGCEPALSAQDTWLASFFTTAPEVEQAGARLTLTGSDATLEFLDREIANPDRPLTGRTWTIDTLIDGAAASNYQLDSPPTVVFGASGSLEVFAGCNNGNGTYAIDGQTLTFSSVAYTVAACISEVASSVESHVRQVFSEGEVTFEIDAARLTVTHGDLGVSATTD